MRQLITNDVFKMSKILKKLELKSNDLHFTDGGDSDEQIGLALLVKILENAYLAQNEVNDFMGGLCGMTGEEFGQLPLEESIKIINEFKELKGISNFFEQAGRLMKSQQST